MAVVVAAIAGCNAPLNKVNTASTYYVQAMVISDLSNNHTRIDMTLTKSGAAYKLATVTFMGTALDTNSTGYYKQFTVGAVKLDSFYTLTITDSSSLSTNLTITLPQSLTINSPASRYFSGGSVTVTWTASHRADGYILATEPPYGVSVDSGYSAYVSNNGGAITPDAFLTNQDRTTGTHYIYVLAYAGAPIASTSLPVALPTSGTPDDNVSQATISGRVCGLIISAPDSIKVQTAQ